MYSHANNPFASVPQIDARSVYDRWVKGEVSIVDVREQSEWELGHIEGVELIPLGQLPERWKELNPDEQWICVCRSGNRSNYAAAALCEAGIKASNMRGGMLEWKEEKLPITPPGIVDSH
ncbi:MAG: rhodanese-like domain-containing protein [Chloroflexi bacterium]|nr:rhodanese-like domain-containing protein [Chloroflexota bacterium]